MGKNEVIEITTDRDNGKRGVLLSFAFNNLDSMDKIVVHKYHAVDGHNYEV